MKTLIFFPESKSDLTQNTPPLKMKILSWVQIWPYPEHPPPPKMKTNFLSPVQIWPYPEHPPKWKLIFFPESKSDLTQNTPQNEN